MSLPARTLSKVAVIPASVIGVPLVSLTSITPPCACVILIAPVVSTAAVTLVGANAVKSETNVVAVIPVIVTVTGVVMLFEPLSLALIVNVSPITNAGVVKEPVISVAPVPLRTITLIVAVSLSLESYVP